MVLSSVILFYFILFEAIEKILHLLDVQRVCQLIALLAVIWHSLGKAECF
jgi:hypothetical protein